MDASMKREPFDKSYEKKKFTHDTVTFIFCPECKSLHSVDSRLRCNVPWASRNVSSFSCRFSYYNYCFYA